MKPLCAVFFALFGWMPLIAGSPAAVEAPSMPQLGHDYVYVQATMTKDIFVVDAETFEIAGHIAVGDYTDDVIGFGLRVKRRDVMPVAVSCLGG